MTALTRTVIIINENSEGGFLKLVGIVLVSHSSKIAEGLKELIEEMVDSESKNENLKIYSAGGTEDGRLGTSAVTISEIFNDMPVGSDILVFCDLGSAYLSAEMALDLVEDDISNNITIVKAPLVEGSFLASVQVSIGSSKSEAIQAVEAEFHN